MLTNIAPPLLIVAAILYGWEVIVQIFEVPHYILPAPSRIAGVLARDYALLLRHAAVTLLEVVIGFIIALVTGVALALAIFANRIVERAFYPFVIASQTIPVFALAPLLVFSFGYGIGSKVLMAALIVFFPIVVNTVDGLRAVDRDAVDLLRIMEASPWQIMLKVRAPAALPHLFTGMRIGVSVCVIGAVIGEWVGAKAGLGYLMIHANAQLRIDLIFAAIFVLSLIGVGLFAAVTLLERWIIPWRRLMVAAPNASRRLVS